MTLLEVTENFWRLSFIVSVYYNLDFLRCYFYLGPVASFSPSSNYYGYKTATLCAISSNIYLFNLDYQLYTLFSIENTEFILLFKMDNNGKTVALMQWHFRKTKIIDRNFLDLYVNLFSVMYNDLNQMQLRSHKARTN